MKKDVYKVLWYSDSPVSETGFAQVAKQILKTLYATGKYEFVIDGINHFDTWYDQKEYPYQIHAPLLTGEAMGKKLFIDMLQRADYDIVFTFNDLGVVSQFREVIKQIRATGKKFVWVCYCPVDTDLVDIEQIKPLQQCDIPVTYTKFAYDVVTKLDPTLKTKLRVIGHGTEPELFKPLEKEIRNKLKADLFRGNENTFIVGNINRNQWRKDLMRSMVVFREFKNWLISQPEYADYDTKLYLHSKVIDQGGNLAIQSKFAGLEQAKDIMFSEISNASSGIPRQSMNLIYNACDVVISTTLGEGWGLSCTEAMCAGVPVIMPRNTSLVEIVGENEERGRFADSGKTLNDFVCQYASGQNWLRPTTDIDSMVERLKEVFLVWVSDRNDPRLDKAREYALQNTWESVNSEWLKVFESAVKKYIKL